MPEPGFVWMRVGTWEAKRTLVFTCPQCKHVNVDPETIPPTADPDYRTVMKPRLGFCTSCAAFVRTPTDVKP